jgi:hypothetical protein
MILDISKDELPPYITIEADVDFGQLYSPVEANCLPGRPCSRSEILKALCPEDRRAVSKAMKEGFHPVLIADLESGAAGIEMRRHVPIPAPPKRGKFYAGVLYSERIQLSATEAQRVAMKLNVDDSLTADLSKALSKRNARELKAILKQFGSFDYEQIVSPKDPTGDQYLIVRRPSQAFNVRFPIDTLSRVQHLAGKLGLPTQIMIEKIVEYFASSEEMLEQTVLKAWVEDGGDARRLKKKPRVRAASNSR